MVETVLAIIICAVSTHVDNLKNICLPLKSILYLFKMLNCGCTEIGIYSDERSSFYFN